MATVSELQVRISADTKDAESGLARVDSAVQNTASQSGMLGGAFGALGGIATHAIGTLVAGAFTSATNAIAGFGGDVISLASEFEAGMNRFASVAGGSLAAAGVSLDDVRAKALQLGADTQFSAAQAQDAMISLAKGGVPVQAIMGSTTDAVLSLAAASETALAPAADIMAKQLGVWAKSGVEATQITDLLAQAANASTVDVEELAAGMNNAGGRAQALNVGYQDFVTTMALLAPSFSSAQQAGTSYNNFLSSLTPTTDGAIDAMKSLGLITADGANKFFDSTGAFVGNKAAAELLKGALSGLSAQQEAVALKAIFGNDAMGSAVALAQAGASGYDQMAASMTAAGSASEQAAQRQQGFSFAMETLNGSLDTLKIVLGSALLPVLTQFIGTITTGVNSVITFAQAVLQAPNALQEFFNQLNNLMPGLGTFAQQAYTWGAAIAEQFASGIMQAVSAVASALQYIGSIIAYWLQPNSPPKIVPNLDQWGTQAANVYLAGWTNGDYSILQELGSTLETTLKNLVDMGQFNEVDVIPRVLGAQGALQDAISQLRETGTVGADALQRVKDAAGPAGDSIAALLGAYGDLERATADVAAAQQSLNDVTAAFDSRLAPLNAELDALDQKKRALDAQVRLEALQKKLSEGKLTDAERQKAELEIQEIQLRSQIDTVKAEKDVAVDAGKAKLDAAKEAQKAAQDNVRTQQAAIQATQHQNDLIGQQVQLLQRIAKEQASAAKSAAGGAGKGGGGIKLPTGGGGPAMPKLEMPDAKGITGPIQAIGKTVNDAKQRFIEFKDKVAESMQTVGTTVSPAIATMRSAFEGIKPALSDISSIFSRVGDTLATVGEKLKGGDIAGAIGTMIAGLAGVDKQFFAVAGKWIMGILNGISQNFPTIVAEATKIGTTIIATLGAALPGIISTLAGWGLALVQWIVTNGPTMLGQLQQMAFQLLETLGAQVPGIVATLAIWGKAFFDWVVAAAPGMVGQLATLGANLIGWIAEQVPGILLQLATWAAQFALWIVGDAAPKLLAAAGTMFADFITWIIQNGPGIYQKLTEWAVLFGTWISDKAIPALLTALAGLWSSFSGWISETAGKISADGSIGKAIADGVKKGIEAGWGALKGFVAQKAKELLDAATGALRINSPSREFHDKVGVQIVAGIITGVQSMQGQAIASVTDLSNKMLKGAADATAKFARDQISVQSSLADLGPDTKKLGDIDRQIKRNRDIVQFSHNEQERIRAERDLNRLIKDRNDLMAYENDAAAQIAEVQKNAQEAMKTNPQIATQYYELRTRQIIELAKLQKEYDNAQGDTERARIQATIDLTKQAQQAESDAFNITMQEAAATAGDTAANALADTFWKTIDDMRSRMTAFLKESLDGVAGLDRQRGSDKRKIANMLTPDADKLAALAAEEAQLRVTAAQNIDPGKRAAAQERLLEIAAERIELEKKTNAQKQIGLKAQAALKQAEAEAAEIRKTDPKLAAEYYDLKSKHILELADLEKERSEATSDVQRNAIDEQIALVKEAQDAEDQQFAIHAQDRKKDVADFQTDMTNAVAQFGENFSQIIRGALTQLSTGLAQVFNQPQQLPVLAPSTPASGTGAGQVVIGPPGQRNAGIASAGAEGASPLIGNLTVEVDARGSAVSEARVKQLVKEGVLEAVNEVARKADLRNRTR